MLGEVLDFMSCHVFFNSFGNVYHIKMEILGLKEEIASLLCALAMVNSTRKS